MINIKNISFSYGDNLVLKNVSFKVDNSESLVIMGPSGSGKSTILRLILGLECPSEGIIEIENKNICVMGEKDKRKLRKKIGMVFQHGALFDSLTVGENTGYYLIEHTNLKYEEIEERVREMLGFVGLDANEIIDKLPEELSGGMQRRVAIGRALLSTDPKVMLFDEPTTGLDPKATRNVLDLIEKLYSEKAISNITVTHQIYDAVNLADRFVVIYEGEVAFDGNLIELRDSQDERVKTFLKPFINSMGNVLEKKLLAGN
ncbi:MAG: ATP-binding cassette domain-containing protein [candidate division Zixibacteria bacterium]|nr:ATP-binding cassette domain-containing protein [candidate division Zixibacteria bacterium]